MKKTLYSLFFGAVALLTLASCSDEEDELTPNEEQGDAYWAAQATISSSDSSFTSSDEGGAIRFKPEGGQVVVNVSCGCEWEADNTASDLFPTTASSTTLTVTANPISSGEALGGTITLKTSNQKISFATITVTQSGMAYISLSTESLSFMSDGGTEVVTVDSNYDWDYSYGPSVSWFTVVRDGDALTVSAVANDDEDEREGIISLTAGDEAGNIAEAQITVTQGGRWTTV